MYWRIRSDYAHYRMLLDSGNIYGSQDYLEMVPDVHIDQDELIFKLSDQRDLPTSDFFLTGHSGILFAKKEVFSFFKKEIEKSRHRFYSGKYDGGDLNILCIFEEVGGFDFRRSIYKLFDDADIESIIKLTVVETFHTDLDIFRLNDNFGVRFDLIVSDAFKKKYDDNNLTGLVFLEAM